MRVHDNPSAFRPVTRIRPPWPGLPVVLVGLAALLATLLAALPSDAATYSVGVDTFRFVPPTLTIVPGDSVHWHLIKGTHTVTAGTDCVMDQNPIFNYQMYPSHPDFTYGFTAPGVYNYFCQLHCVSMGMKGTITVQDLSAAPAAPSTITGVDPRIRLLVTPNPTRGAASIGFALVQAGRVRFEILDPAGRSVRSLDRGGLAAGSHTVAWDGTDSEHRPLRTGIYFVRMIGAGVKAESRFVVLS